MKLQTLPLYEKLIELRQEQHLSQRELAKKLGLAQSYLSKIETGKTDMGLANFVELVRYLGAEVMIVPAPLVPVVSAVIMPRPADGKEKRPRWAENIEDELEGDQ